MTQQDDIEVQIKALEPVDLREADDGITFDELVRFGIDCGAPLTNGIAWSFQYKGLPVTHENDQCYLIGSQGTRFIHGCRLFVGADGTFLICLDERDPLANRITFEELECYGSESPENQGTGQAMPFLYKRIHIHRVSVDCFVVGLSREQFLRGQILLTRELEYLGKVVTLSEILD